MASGQEWHAWLGRHGPAMLLLARQWVPGRADAEDVVQEAFLRFWRSPQRAESSVADPVAYLFGCVKHAAMDYQRGGRRRARREEAAGIAAAPNESGPDPMLTGGLERE